MSALMFHRRKPYRLGTTGGWVNEHSLMNLRSSDNVYLLLTFSMCFHNHCRTEYLATASLFKQVTKSQKCSLVLFFSPLWASVEVLLGERGELSQMCLCKELCGRQRERERQNGEGEKCRKKNRGTNWKKEGVREEWCAKREDSAADRLIKHAGNYKGNEPSTLLTHSNSHSHILSNTQKPWHKTAPSFTSRDVRNLCQKSNIKTF